MLLLFIKLHSYTSLSTHTHTHTCWRYACSLCQCSPYMDFYEQIFSAAWEDSLKARCSATHLLQKCLWSVLRHPSVFWRKFTSLFSLGLPFFLCVCFWLDCGIGAYIPRQYKMLIQRCYLQNWYRKLRHCSPESVMMQRWHDDAQGICSPRLETNIFKLSRRSRDFSPIREVSARGTVMADLLSGWVHFLVYFNTKRERSSLSISILLWELRLHRGNWKCITGYNIFISHTLKNITTAEAAFTELKSPKIKRLFEVGEFQYLLPPQRDLRLLSRWEMF